MQLTRNTAEGVFCPCCGMALRATPSARRDREKLRQNQHVRVLSQRLINEEGPLWSWYKLRGS